MLTGRQQEILQFIQRFIDERGFPPTLREIGQGVGITAPSTVFTHVTALTEAGWLEREEGKPRAMRVTEPDEA
jgi:repressor LexA